MGPAPSGRHGSLRKSQVVRRVLQSDPGQEYYVYVPGTAGADAPICVAVHGISRNAHELAKLFAVHAERTAAVLVAPYFSPERYSDYQRLGRSGRGTRADVVLDSIVEEVAWLTGADATQIYLFGYSGGAQFAHRYAMAYPQRVARAVVASAGWYTFPDARERFPYGIAPNRELPSVRFDPEEFLRVPMTVLVGELDTTDEGLRRTERVDRQQGETRVERARKWVEAMREAARAYRVEPRVSFEAVPGGDHSFKRLVTDGRLGERVFEALFGAALAHPVRAEDGGNGNL
jgi:pimeloyl-ACP methyl ester carboxylesterase